MRKRLENESVQGRNPGGAPASKEKKEHVLGVGAEPVMSQ